MTKRGLKSKYERAKRRVAKERKIIDNAQQRQRYWERIQYALSSRLNLVEQGQIEMNGDGF